MTESKGRSTALCIPVSGLRMRLQESFYVVKP